MVERICLVSVAVIACSFLAVAAYARLSGGATLTVLTGSMEPGIPTGSLILVTPTDAHAIAPGDVITFQAAPGVAEYVTHRVVRVQPDTDPYSFITKGDANPGEDVDPVPAGAVRGVVRFHIPYVGRISQLVRSPLGLLLLAAVPAFVFIRRQVQVIRGELSPDGTTPPDHPEPVRRTTSPLVGRAAAVLPAALRPIPAPATWSTRPLTLTWTVPAPPPPSSTPTDDTTPERPLTV